MTFLHIVERDQQTIDDSVHLTKCQIQIGGNRALTRSYFIVYKQHQKDNQNSVVNTAVLTAGGQDITSTTPDNPGLGDATSKHMVTRSTVNCVTADEKR
ncbi:uncharacterized protein N7518_004993 [Penicillium psychrosexuale]|uniref:uncharacterized protein n=1 Tax=Penicillium psychrosexuale TaxID=1002107 RepID=UPI002545866B|nr:uncharacterized protein N7518_004993 [Penicillium psychrosexuale]KAJ5796453.1 hypothetical protein N7518_004993 [Penicillium psychrosexuale]